MEAVYIEILKFLNEGSIFRVLLVIFSSFCFLLLAGVGFIWFKNPELLNEILHTLSLKKPPELIEREEVTTALNSVPSPDLIRGLSSASVDFIFSKNGAILKFPQYMRTRLEDGLKDLLLNIITSVREIPTKSRSIELNFTETFLVNPICADCIFEVIQEVQANNGVYLVLCFKGKELSEFEVSIRKLLKSSESKSVNVRKRR
ncbi:hypothetical protein [Leptospira stimsonii]|uniref:GerMN domain-containing protein n=1 Tax=Leptospira stimsonii TaxID=2202203 RepID=A0ABY2MV09_9LEPT|nr:hypothetical protein [Leptospira stimsonii]TGK25378.1 hypothetical protein EHO98_02980 [Leptospira stimsonii]TGM08797.1 hypothetical protein EHQ90_22165 [Leptospira stimsonii]